MRAIRVWNRLGVALLLAALAAPASAAPAAQPAKAEPPGDYGVMLAMSGEGARAESIFVSMLSHTRGDARALNNLGNLRVLHGDLGVALAFYDRALRGDSTDAGIHLNRATTLMLMGDDARAEAAAAEGVRLAGGEEQANAVLGIKNEKGAGRAAEKAFVNRGEIKALLHRAASAVPTDTAKPAVRAPAPGAAKAKTPTWRSAGPRASEQSEAAQVLYWKR